jgi:hypothetical protein
MGSPLSGNSIYTPREHTGRGTRAPQYPFLEIADAAEQTWLRAEGARIFT